MPGVGYSGAPKKPKGVARMRGGLSQRGRTRLGSFSEIVGMQWNPSVLISFAHDLESASAEPPS